MGRKYKKLIAPVISDSQSDMQFTPSPRSSESSSSSDSDSSQSLQKDLNEIKLSKKDLLKLIKLEKAIEAQEEILEKERNAKKVKSLNKIIDRKKTPKREQKSPTPSVSEKVSTKKKLFITAIDQRYSEEEVDHELSKLLNNIQGVVNFRVKKKQVSSTYAFVDFISKEYAAEGLEKLKKKKLFGQKMTICYSQDDQRQNTKLSKTNSGIKKCFQCNGKGHFAKECHLRKKFNKQPKTDEMSYFSGNKVSENTNFQQDEEKSQEEFIKYESDLVKLQPEKGQTIKRVVREKSGLNRLPHL